MNPYSNLYRCYHVCCEFIQYSCRTVFWATKELAALMVTQIFLSAAATPLIVRYPNRKREIKIMTVWAPLTEELLFRVVLQGGIGWAQKKYAAYNNKILSEEDKKIKKLFRIRLTAFIYASCHLTNSNSRMHQLFQFIWSYMGGVSFGAVKERYGLALSVLAHGTSNLVTNYLQHAFSTTKYASTATTVAVVSWRILTYQLLTTEL